MSKVDSRLRILHAPNNICGQTYFLAKAQRKLGYESNSMAFARHNFAYPIDECLELQDIEDRNLRRGKMWTYFCECLEKYDIFHFHFKETLLIPSYDLPVLKMKGKKIVRSYWGDDIRIPSMAGSRNPYFNRYQHHNSEDELIKRISYEREFIDFAIVADLEVYNYARQFYPESKIKVLPVGVDIERYKPNFPDEAKNKPTIVHAPSARGLKGTKEVIQTINKLRSDGYSFNFILVEGKSHQEAIEIYGQADIVIDQLLIGGYGFVSIESMALGKPVLCYLQPEYYPQEVYDTIPIIKTDCTNLYDELKKLIVDPSLRYRIGIRSRKYVEGYFNIDTVAKALINIYETL